MLVRQVEEGILQQLKSGQYAPGEKLPSLRELSREFGCSYVIAFRAVQSLKNSGYLETAKGNGIFVTGDARSKMEKKLIVYISDCQESSQLTPQDLLRYSCFQRIVREAGFVDLALNEEESLSSDQMNQLAGASQRNAERNSGFLSGQLRCDAPSALLRLSPHRRGDDRRQ